MVVVVLRWEDDLVDEEIFWVVVVECEVLSEDEVLFFVVLV